jgi:hypothetical protein
MEFIVATFTVLYRTSAMLLTFNILPFLYESPVYSFNDGRMDWFSLKIRRAKNSHIFSLKF